jgi:hypothetical protein
MADPLCAFGRIYQGMARRQTSLIRAQHNQYGPLLLSSGHMTPGLPHTLRTLTSRLNLNLRDLDRHPYTESL